MSKRQRQVFNNLQKFSDVLSFLKDEFGMLPRLFTPEEFLLHRPIDISYEDRLSVYENMKPEALGSENDFDLLYDCENSDGKYFKSRVGNDTDGDSDCDWSGMFLEND